MAAGRFIVVTGTDTGVGKTVVTAGLGRALARAGRKVLAIKPVESGCGPEPVATEDGALLAEATGQAAPRQAWLRLRAPMAPALAAELEQLPLDPPAWIARLRTAAEGAEVVLVEGAGGLLAPLSWSCTIADVASELAARVLVVGADRLGVQNHVLLTLSELRARSLEPLGVVLSAPPEPDASTGTNLSALRRLLQRFALEGRVAAIGRVASTEDAANQLSTVTGWIDAA